MVFQHSDTATSTAACEAEETESIINFECPCGGCSLETYLQDGCPISCIPYLGMTNLSEEDQEILTKAGTGPAIEVSSTTPQGG